MMNKFYGNNSNNNIVGMIEIGNWSLDIRDLILEPEPFAKGAFGRVHKADYLGTPVCVKIISRLAPDEEDYFKFTQREVAALKSLSHPNLVQFIGASETSKEIYIVTEFVSGGTVRKHLKNKQEEVPWHVRISVALDVASAMAFLHARQIMHRDLKSKNLLVTENWRVKLCDFGFARSIKDKKQNKHMTLCGTEEYMAPEVIFGMHYNQSAEVYSFGLLMCEIITRYKIEEIIPRTPATEYGLDHAGFRALVPGECPRYFLEVALRCCAYEPKDRPEFRDITQMLRKIKEEYAAPLSPSIPAYVRDNRGVTVSSLNVAYAPQQQQNPARAVSPPPERTVSPPPERAVSPPPARATSPPLPASQPQQQQQKTQQTQQQPTQQKTVQFQQPEKLATVVSAPAVQQPTTQQPTQPAAAKPAAQPQPAQQPQPTAQQPTVQEPTEQEKSIQQSQLEKFDALIAPKSANGKKVPPPVPSREGRPKLRPLSQDLTWSKSTEFTS